ncbi:hypothetical protein JG559_09535 [Enterococcus faecalis]|uniref:Uncharacterized protein n=1 Tax=Enterococcus faecalis TaxID=1351 RepID=A0A974NZ02_ENTFL|nr:hypothetical protein JG559_09535 [Enterococcus faecalis]
MTEPTIIKKCKKNYFRKVMGTMAKNETRKKVARNNKNWAIYSYCDRTLLFRKKMILDRRQK